MNSLLPTQIGYTPLSSGTPPYPSQVVIGRDITASFEAVGFGDGGRPDPMSLLKINLTNQAVDPAVKVGSISMSATGLAAIISANFALLGQPLNFTFQEVALCVDVNGTATEKRAVVLMSQSYLPAGS